MFLGFFVIIQTAVKSWIPAFPTEGIDDPESVDDN